jgi:hypothetical protein
VASFFLYDACMLKVLRPGTRHHDVEMWEEFLQGYGFCNTEVDRFFNDNSVDSTKLFQEEHGLDVDGWVGKNTWAKAIELGLDILEDDTTERDGPNWPPPTDLQPVIGTQGRMAAWGKMTFKPAGTPGNPEGIAITNDWPEKSVVTANISQIDRIPGMQYKGQLVGAGPKSVSIHNKVLDSFIELWQRWDDAGLLDNIITWAGTWNPRFIRGSRTSLSNHAFATAFDINAPWNGLRRVPALMGKKGCVRELVPIANELGWYWGGHFKRKDGMHFEATLKCLR